MVGKDVRAQQDQKDVNFGINNMNMISFWPIEVIFWRYGRIVAAFFQTELLKNYLGFA